MKLNDAYPSNFLTAEDLGGRDITITIQDIELEDLGQGAKKEKKLAITMAGKKKKFIVNKTNANTIAKVLGTDETDDWIGQRIIIGPREVEFQGEMVWSIRVSLRLPTSTQAAAAEQPAAPRQPAPPVQQEIQEGADPDLDDIPF